METESMILYKPGAEVIVIDIPEGFKPRLVSVTVYADMSVGYRIRYWNGTAFADLDVSSTDVLAAVGNSKPLMIGFKDGNVPLDKRSPPCECQKD